MLYEVITILEKESLELNRRFFTYHNKQRPYIILKWAQTLDGFVDIDRDQAEYGQPTWITNEWARRAVHQQRATEEAILVGTYTVLKDNPSLTLRDWTGHQPLRLIIDKQCRVSSDSHILDGMHASVVYNYIRSETQGSIDWVRLQEEENLNQQILNDLFDRGVQSLIVEGGQATLDSFISANLWDEAHVYIGDRWFINGVKAPVVKGQIISEDAFGDSKRYIYRNRTVKV